MNDEDPIAPARAIVLGVSVSAAAMIGLLVLLLSGCASSRETTTDTTDRGRVRLETPVVIDSPLGPWTIRPFSATADRRTLAQSTEEASYRPDVAQIAPLIESGGMGVGGPLAGLAGLAFGAWRMLSERKTSRALDDAVAYGKDVAAIDPNDRDRMDAVKRDHRQRQIQRGTNDRIKARL